MYYDIYLKIKDKKIDEEEKNFVEDFKKEMLKLDFCEKSKVQIIKVNSLMSALDFVTCKNCENTNCMYRVDELKNGTEIYSCINQTYGWWDVLYLTQKLLLNHYNDKIILDFHNDNGVYKQEYAYPKPDTYYY